MTLKSEDVPADIVGLTERTVTIAPTLMVDVAKLKSKLTDMDRYFGDRAVKVKAWGIQVRPSTAQLRLALKDRDQLTRTERNRCYQWLLYRQREARRRLGQ